MNIKTIEKALNLMVEKGYLKKTKNGYIDSNKVTKLLSKGKTRDEISIILEKKYKEKYKKRGCCGGVL